MENVVKDSEIILDWLGVKANRDKLPVWFMDKDEIAFLNNYATIYDFGPDDDTDKISHVYNTGIGYFKVKEKSEISA